MKSGLAVLIGYSTVKACRWDRLHYNFEVIYNVGYSTVKVSYQYKVITD